jgi:hypothetical protein
MALLQMNATMIDLQFVLFSHFSRTAIPSSQHREQILSWLLANPERSSGDIFRELQCRSPGRYQPLQIRTLQRGMRKIRAYLLETQQEQWQDEVIRGPLPR